MKILLVEFYAQPNADYPKIAEQWRLAGHPTLVGALNGQGELEWREGDKLVAKQALGHAQAGSGGSVLRILKNRYYRMQQLRQIRNFIREYDPDLVQINASNFYRLLPIGMPRRTRYVLDVRQINEVYGTNALSRLRAWLINNSRGVFSRRIYDRTTFLHEAGAEKVLGPDWRRWASIVPFAVDPQFTTVSRVNGQPARAGAGAAVGAAGAPLDNGPGQDDGRVDFIYLGRLTRRRLLERLVQASAIAKQKTSDFRFIFLGIDESDGYYQQMIADMELDDVVVFEPPVTYEEVPAEVLKHDVAVAYVPELPIDWKYHPPIKILEYQALGMPILATDFKPNHSFVEPGVNGLLVDNDPELIAEAMLRFIEDPEFLADCRAAAATMRGVQTWDVVAQMYLDKVYLPLVNGTEAVA